MLSCGEFPAVRQLLGQLAAKAVRAMCNWIHGQIEETERLSLPTSSLGDIISDCFVTTTSSCCNTAQVAIQWDPDLSKKTIIKSMAAPTRQRKRVQVPRSKHLSEYLNSSR